MSDTDTILPNSPLGRALGSESVPELPSGFADRVVAHTSARPKPLPEPRRRRLAAARWRSVRRLGIVAVGAGALATAAAAMGLLDDLPVDLPSGEQVWGMISGREAQPVAIPQPVISAPNVKANPAFAPQDDAPMQIEGAIDTPEELEEAFRRIDQVRERKKAARRENVDRRIDNAIERRRAQGLRVPTPEQEARLRGRIERLRERADTGGEQRLQERRENLRDRVQSGEPLTREDFLPEQRRNARNPEMRKRIEELRNLPPAERQERIRQLRQQRREQRLQRRIQLQEQPAGSAPVEQEIPEEER